jgi:hypothetical protein
MLLSIKLFTYSYLLVLLIMYKLMRSLINPANVIANRWSLFKVFHYMSNLDVLNNHRNNNHHIDNSINAISFFFGITILPYGIPILAQAIPWQ